MKIFGTLPRPAGGACLHVAIRCSPARGKPAPPVQIRPRPSIALHRRGRTLRMAAGVGGSMEDLPPSVDDDDFLATAAFTEGDTDLDEDEKAMLLGGTINDSDDDPLEFDDEDLIDEDEMVRRRGVRARGRVVESSLDDVDDLDALIMAEERGAPLRSRATVDADYSEASSGGEATGEGTYYPPLPERRRRLPELLRAAGFSEEAETAPDVEIMNIITCNSESASEGSLYVCVPAEEDPEDEELDGHNWADEAAELGAVAVVAEFPLPDCLLPVVVVKGSSLKALGHIAAEFYDRPSNPDQDQGFQTVAFIGSYGKTTSSWLARGILEEAGEQVGLIGDSEYSIGVDRLTLEGDLWEPTEEDSTANLERSSPFRLTQRTGKYELPPTTPDALHLQKVLAGIKDRGAGVALVEVCPKLAADGRVDAFKPSVLVFTNVEGTVADLDPSGGDVYKERIADMFLNLSENQTAIINIDDRYGQTLARLVGDSKAQLLTYGVTSKDADVFPERMKPTIWETELLVRTPVGRLEINLPVVASFNVANAMAAVAVGLAMGKKLVDIVAGIEAVDVIPGRTEVIDLGQPFPVIVDSAKTPAQLGRLVDEMKEAGARRTILVIGCQGGTSAEYRAEVGYVAHFKSDIVFFTNDSPGLESPREIIEEITNGLPEEILGRHAGSMYAWLQDVHRVPQWFEPFMIRYQSEIGRYVIEDRFSAIRVAIGLAKARDVVIIAGRGQDDRMIVWDGIPPPRSEAERALGQASKLMSDSVNSPDYEEEEKLEAVDEYWKVQEEEGRPIEPGTLVGWFDDSVESRNAIARLTLHLNKLKDLDRSTLPWTRYPEERETSPLSRDMGAAAAMQGNLDRYLSQGKSPSANYQEYDDSSDGEEEDEEQEEDLEEMGKF